MAVEKKYNKLPVNQRGGVLYLNLTLCEIFQMSPEVKEAMLTFINLFKCKGVVQYTGENIIQSPRSCLEQKVGCCTCSSGGAHRGYLDGSLICGNASFHFMFEHVKQSDDLDNLEVLNTIGFNATMMEKFEAILEKAADVYDKLCTAQV